MQAKIMVEENFVAILKGAEPFLLPGGTEGVLLIHGFTGSPAEMVLLGQYLHECGYTVLAPRLSGHGTTPEDMSITNWANWYNSVRDGYHLLKGLCTSISVVGLSMGGLLAIKLAIDYDIHRVVALSSPIYIMNKGVRLIPALKDCIGRYIPKKRRKITDIDPIYTVSYNKMPLASVHSLLALIRHIAKYLPKLTRPFLIIQSKNDHTVNFRSAAYLYRSAGSLEKELLWLEKSGHLVTLDTEKDIVFAKIADFFHKSAKLQG